MNVVGYNQVLVFCLTLRILFSFSLQGPIRYQMESEEFKIYNFILFHDVEILLVRDHKREKELQKLLVILLIRSDIK